MRAEQDEPQISVTGIRQLQTLAKIRQARSEVVSRTREADTGIGNIGITAIVAHTDGDVDTAASLGRIDDITSLGFENVERCSILRNGQPSKPSLKMRSDVSNCALSDDCR